MATAMATVLEDDSWRKLETNTTMFTQRYLLFRVLLHQLGLLLLVHAWFLCCARTDQVWRQRWWRYVMVRPIVYVAVAGGFGVVICIVVKAIGNRHSYANVVQVGLKWSKAPRLG